MNKYEWMKKWIKVCTEDKLMNKLKKVNELMN